jgi:Phospholipase_D-nuclease N-terminal
MLVLGALVAMLATGVWLYCLVDILVTSRAGCRHLPKPVWLAVVVLTFVAGATAWLLLGRPAGGDAAAGVGTAGTAAGPRRQLRRSGGVLQQGDQGQRTALARSRHPAGRGRPIGPDDDPEFLRELDYLIRGGYDTDNGL